MQPGAGKSMEKSFVFLAFLCMAAAFAAGCGGNVVVGDLADVAEDISAIDTVDPADHGGRDVASDHGMTDVDDHDSVSDPGTDPGGDHGIDTVDVDQDAQADEGAPDAADVGDDAEDLPGVDAIDHGQSDQVDPDAADPGREDVADSDAMEPDSVDSDAVADAADVAGDAGTDVLPGPCADGVPEYVGDQGWTGQINVTEAATYCWPFDESLTLRESMARKSRIRLIPGTYPVPTVGEGLSMVLPFCVEFAPGVGGPSHSGQGTVRAGEWGFQYRQPMIFGAAWEFEMSQWASTTTLDGTGSPGSMVLCESSCADWMDRRRFDSCTYDNVDRQIHTIGFEGGQIVLELRIGMSMASTEPGIFFSATGTLDGKAFDVTDYWKLVYRPAHHHFSRHFAVLLDSLEFGTCSIMVENAVPWPDQPGAELPTVSLADCLLNVTKTKKVTSHTFKRVSP